MGKRKLVSINPNIIPLPKSKSESNNKINIILFALIILAILYLYWYHVRDILESSVRLPHAYNQDEEKLVGKEKNSPVIGMEPKTHQNVHELTQEEKDINNPDFYTVSELMPTDAYFDNNEQINIKNLDDNCKDYYDPKKPGIYIDCLEKHKLLGISNEEIYKEYHDVNIYSDEKIMNGGEFMNGITGANI